MTTARGSVSRRNFLRLKPVDRGRTVELSVRTLFMQCADAPVERVEAGDGEPSMGGPAAADRPSIDELLQDFARQLDGVRVLKLFEPEWLESMGASDRVRAVLAEFEARGGRVEEQW